MSSATRTIETTEYGEVSNSHILEIFGDEMTYNDLKFYAKNQNNTTYLKVEINRNEETQLVRVWLDNQIKMDKEYSIHYSCDMFYQLNELEKEIEVEEESEDVTYDDRGAKVKWNKETEGWDALCEDCDTIWAEGGKYLYSKWYCGECAPYYY